RHRSWVAPDYGGFVIRMPDGFEGSVTPTGGRAVNDSAAADIGPSRSVLQAWEAAGDIVAGVLRDPAFGIAEQADGHEMRILAHVEPVPGAGGHRDKVVLLAQHGVDHVLDVQAEQAATGDEKSHLVFGMAVFVQEPGAQLGLLRVIAGDAEHVHGGIATLVHQAVDLRSVSGNHLVRTGPCGKTRAGFPALELHARFGQGGGDILDMGEYLEGMLGRTFVIDAEDAHGRCLSGPGVAPGWSSW